MSPSKKQILEEINRDLYEVIGSATTDFREVNSLLMDYYETIGKTATANDLTDKKVASVITNLQHLDIFRQRIEHLVQVHNQFISDQWEFDGKESFYHLHIFQALTIELDLLKSISAIEALLLELKHRLFSAEDPQIKNPNYFIHTPRIKEILRKTILIWNREGGEKHSLPMPPIKPDHLEKIHALYTMESERLVLSWFLKSMPKGSWEELADHYQAELSEIKNQNIELF